jgi:hypothetical protein
MLSILIDLRAPMPKGIGNDEKIIQPIVTVTRLAIAASIIYWFR